MTASGMLREMLLCLRLDRKASRKGIRTHRLRPCI